MKPTETLKTTQGFDLKRKRELKLIVRQLNGQIQGFIVRTVEDALKDNDVKAAIEFIEAHLEALYKFS